MPGEGVSRANPTVLLWQPPQTGLGLLTKAGWGMAGRWAKTALHYSRPEEKQSPGSFPNSGCSCTPQLGPWTCLFMPLTSGCSLTTQGQSPRNRQAVPSPGFLQALPFYPCLLFLKLSHQTLSHTFPPSGRRGCPPTGRLLWPRATQAGSQDGRLQGTCWLEKRPCHGHPGPDPHWAISPTCILPTLLQLLCKPTQQGWLYPQPHTASGCRGDWGRTGTWAGVFFLPSEITGPLPVWSHLCFHFLGTN